MEQPGTNVSSQPTDMPHSRLSTSSVDQGLVAGSSDAASTPELTNSVGQIHEHTPTGDPVLVMLFWHLLRLSA